MTFDKLGLIQPLLDALRQEGYTKPTPIQEQAIPLLLQGNDILGCAQTGTGKTAAFALPILQLLHSGGSPAPVAGTASKLKEWFGAKPVATPPPASKRTAKQPLCLILTPTRELAIQIGESFSAYGRNLGIRHTVIFGGVGQKPQTDALQRGVEVVIATPGRLLDLMGQGYVHLEKIEIFVLDEADRMLDMGFIHDVKRVIQKLPTKRQTLFFSATMPPDVSRLANTILTNPRRVEVTPQSTTAEKVQQQLFHVDKGHKRALLVHVLEDPAIKSALVFTRTKHGANKVVKDLEKSGITAEAIHGNKSQTARQKALSNFKGGATRVLVATDIAARGIDIDDLGHVINYEIPNIPETYVHRIGRTGRAGASGLAISFCDNGEEKDFLRDIQKLIGKQIPVMREHPFEGAAPPPREVDERGPRNHQRPRQQSSHRSGSSPGHGGGQRSGQGGGGQNQRPSGSGGGQGRSGSGGRGPSRGGRGGQGRNSGGGGGQRSGGQGGS
ncbi:MAG: DEAD/DEAH box helicase [Flavobacteriales bacterium]|nr:DEAD/DEAH box helicase [Flavobacteriales bacterium]